MPTSSVVLFCRARALAAAALPEAVVLVEQVIYAAPRPVRFGADQEYREEKDSEAGRFHFAHQLPLRSLYPHQTPTIYLLRLPLSPCTFPLNVSRLP